MSRFAFRRGQPQAGRGPEPPTGRRPVAADRTPSYRQGVRSLHWLIVPAACLHLRTANAQQLRGVVRDSAFNAPLPGAVVSVVDSGGGAGSRTISDATGRFAVSLSPRSVRLRVIRIGYRPRDIMIPKGTNPTVDVVMVRLPPVLNAVQVFGDKLCPGSADRGPAFQLWEQARAGLLAAVVAREAKPAMATSLVYKRQLTASDGLVVRQETKVNSGRTSRPFLAAASAAEFAATGYMHEDRNGRMFYAPDADILLDESFATSHCFQLQAADAAHADQIGLAFTPARDRDDVVDVRGVIWMTRASPSLRSLVFRYTELEPASIAAGAGGHLVFRDVANGVSFIERWVLRLPILRPNGPTSRSARRRQEVTELHVTGIDESGGMVLATSWPDGTSWNLPMTGVAGTVVQRSGGERVPFAIVSVDGTKDTVVADATGAFMLTPMVPGRYLIAATDTTLHAFAAPRGTNRTVDVPRDALTVTRFEVAPILGVLNDLCSNQRHRRDDTRETTTIVGRVVLPDSLTERGPTVRGTWQADYTVGAGVAITTGEQVSTVDALGRFALCGVAVTRRLQLRVSAGNVSADTTVKPLPGSFTAVDWRPGRLNPVGSGNLAGVITLARSKAALSGVEVTLMPAGRSVVTGDDGLFEFSDIPAGAYQLRVRGVGHTPVIDSVVVEPGQKVLRSYGLERVASLDTVRSVAAEGKFISPALRGFEERRRGGFGSFIPDSLLRLRENSKLSDLVRMLPGLGTVAGASGSYYAVSSRDTRSGRMVFSPGQPGRCYVSIYIDGVLVFEHPPSPGNPPRNLEDFSVSTLGGVEFYASSATTPPQFKQSQCGTLLLWSREK